MLRTEVDDTVYVLEYAFNQQKLGIGHEIIKVRSRYSRLSPNRRDSLVHRITQLKRETKL